MACIQINYIGLVGVNQGNNGYKGVKMVAVKVTEGFRLLDRAKGSDKGISGAGQEG